LINLLNKVILYEWNFVFTTFTLPHSFLLSPFLFPLIVTWLEYLRAAVYLVLICLQSSHFRFPEFLIYCQNSEKSSKIKFLEKFQKNLFKDLCQKWGREALGRPQGDLPRHLTTRGRDPALAAPTYCEEGPLGFSLISSSPTLSLSWKTMTHQLKLVFLLLSTSIFLSPCSTHHCCWDLEHLFSGMWLLRLSKWNFV
jgi:hypothetical protein